MANGPKVISSNFLSVKKNLELNVNSNRMGKTFMEDISKRLEGNQSESKISPKTT